MPDPTEREDAIERARELVRVKRGKLETCVAELDAAERRLIKAKLRLGDAEGALAALLRERRDEEYRAARGSDSYVPRVDLGSRRGKVARRRGAPKAPAAVTKKGQGARPPRGIEQMHDQIAAIHPEWSWSKCRRYARKMLPAAAE